MSFTAGDHRLDESDASQIAALLSYLRQVQRAFHVAVLVVHHARMLMLLAPVRLCAAPMNCTAGVTPIFTCAASRRPINLVY